MHQDGIEVRPLRQMTGSAEFNEVFFNGARTPRDHVLGEVGQGWKVAMATLGFERGTAFMSQQLAFERELAELIDTARDNGRSRDPIIRDRLAGHYAGVQIMRYNGMRMLTDLVQRVSSVRRPASESSTGPRGTARSARRRWRSSVRIALVVGGKPGGDYELDELHHTFMASRAETIYAGSSEIQRNIIGERVLLPPREPR